MRFGLTACFSSLAILLLAGCVANPLRQYDSELQETIKLVRQGSVKQAVAQLDQNNEPGLITKDQDILYYLEKGELLTLDNNHPGAKGAWLKADEFVREWEDSFKTDPGKLFGDIGSYLINDKTRRYEGQDYEKVMLSTNLTLSHLLQGNYDDARVEMKKTYEREKLIESFREQEYDRLQDEGKKLEVTTSVKDMKGYPLAELDAPEVTELKNGFQNAFAHYLAGYFFEATGEPSLAEPGYRNALQLAPRSKIVQAGLREIGRRKPGVKESDVLFVIESGFAPSWKSITIPIPVPRGKGKLVLTPLSFPLLKSDKPAFVPPTLKVAGKQLPVETLSNIDFMARRMLKDQMPSILLRTVIRAVAKSAAQEQANKGGAILGLVANVASVVSEQADDRNWRTLPERISIARATLPQGTQTIEFQTGSGNFRKKVEIDRRFTIIPIRLTGGAVYVSQPNPLGSVAQGIAEPESEIKPRRPARDAANLKPVKPAE